MTWREAAQPIVAQVLAATRGAPETEIRKALRKAYPWGPRENHPYKIWCDEIRRQRGMKPKLGTRVSAVNPTQASLFEEETKP